MINLDFYGVQTAVIGAGSPNLKAAWLINRRLFLF